METEARTPAVILDRAMRDIAPIVAKQDDDWQPFQADTEHLRDFSEMIAIPLSLALAVVGVAALIGG